MLLDLPDVARSAGLQVVEVDGWRTRSHGPMDASGPRAVVVHHTAGPSSGDAPSLATVRDGRPDLAGPLAHFLLARSGTVHVVAAGLCWHTGATFERWQGNAYAIGIEINRSFVGFHDRKTPSQNYAFQKAIFKFLFFFHVHFRVHPIAHFVGSSDFGVFCFQ